MDIFSVKRYELYFKPSIAKKIVLDTTDEEPTLKVKAELSKSNCFDYGNRTVASILVENLPSRYDPRTVYDTRYDNRAVEDFDKWVKDQLWDKYGANLYKIEDISETLNLKYFRKLYDEDEWKEITYGEALHIMLGTWKDNKYTRAMLTIPNWIECRFSTIKVADYTDPKHPLVRMSGFVNVLPDGMEYEEE